jgi:hypothetical protein
VDQLLAIVVLFKEEVIKLPENRESWIQLRDNFQSRGFPGMVGAIDGSLIELERGSDFEGFYCRKGFPAFNLMAVVDHKKRFISVYVSKGSNNDRGVYNDSKFGKSIQNVIPEECYILGDAGYTLYKHLMIPYPITPNMPNKVANYNLVHSRARIVVEMAFGLYKGKFRIFKKPLDLKSKRKAGQCIIATIILHNWLIDCGSEEVAEVITIEDWMNIEQVNEVIAPIGGAPAIQKREQIMQQLPLVLFQ